MPQQKVENNIEIRSEEVQEILSHIPNWIIRWGITAILCSVIIILIASWFIKYPDVITARVTITTAIPPINIVAKSSGAVKLLISDNENVKKNSILGIIENSADTDDLFYLVNQCNHFAKSSENNAVNFKSNLSLGSIQNPYLQFIKSLNDYKLFKELQYFSKQVSLLQLRINRYQELNQSLQKQLVLLKRELNLNKQNFQTDSTLHAEGVTAKIDRNRAESVLLQAKRNYESAKSNLINNKIQINQLNSQITDLTSKKLEQERILNEAITQSFEQLESQLENWKQQFLLLSPIDGKVSFSTYWSNNQYVNTGDEVMTIVPIETAPFARVEMPVRGSGKVEVGQKVNIKLDNYPYQEYGMILGEVQTKSSVPKNNSYTLTLSLPNGLTSSYNKELSFDREMQGTAEIITKDLRILERVFNQFRSLMDNAG